MTEVRRPGRPRKAQVEVAALSAAREIIAEEGVAVLTLGNVALRIGVGKPTIYRRWPTRGALIFDAVLMAGDGVPVPDTGNGAEDLRQGMRRLATMLTTPIGQAAGRVVLAEALTDAESRRDFSTRRWNRDRQAVSEIFRRALGRRERVAGADPVVLAEMVTAWIVDRCLLRDEPPSEEEVDAVVDVMFPRR